MRISGTTGVVLNKGLSREPGPNPNHDKKEDLNAQRKLVVLQGGKPGQVTHRPKGRCGSAKSRGGKYLSLSDRKAAGHDAEIIEFRRFGYDHQDLLVRNLETASGDVVEVEQATESGIQVVAEPEKPYMWTEADFTPEALAQRPKYAPTAAQAVEMYSVRRAAEELSHRKTLERFSRPGANCPGRIGSSHSGTRKGSKQKR